MLHSAFNFDFMASPWDAAALRASIEQTLDGRTTGSAPRPPGCCRNHDVTRPVTRYGREDTAFAFDTKRFGTPTDLALGTRRARAAALLAMALPGAFYLFQGEELGLPEVEDIPSDRIHDPMHHRSGGVDPGRDGCRVPIPVVGRRTAVRLQPTRRSSPGCPSPTTGPRSPPTAQEGRPDSMLALYRAGLRAAPRAPRARVGPLAWLDLGPHVIAFRRGDDFVSVTNLSGGPIDLPASRPDPGSPAHPWKEAACLSMPPPGSVLA